MRSWRASSTALPESIANKYTPWTRCSYVVPAPPVEAGLDNRLPVAATGLGEGWIRRAKAEGEGELGFSCMPTAASSAPRNLR